MGFLMGDGGCGGVGASKLQGGIRVEPSHLKRAS